MTCSRTHAFITGTSSGIGKATMEAAAAQGWHVFAGDRAQDTGEDEEHGTGLVTRVHVDVTSEADVTAAAELVAAHVGDSGLDALGNVAGIGIPGPIETMPLDDLRKSFEVDVVGQVAVTQALLPLIRVAKGRIIFVGSVVDRTTLPFFGALAMSKSAIASIDGTLRQELAPWGIEVILIEPGFIATGVRESSKALIDKRLADFTPDQAALYGETFKEFTDKGFQTQNAGSKPEVVAEVIMKAFTEHHPKDRYLVGSHAHAVADLGKLPTGIADDLRREEFGLPKPGSEED